MLEGVGRGVWASLSGTLEPSQPPWPRLLKGDPPRTQRVLQVPDCSSSTSPRAGQTAAEVNRNPRKTQRYGQGWFSGDALKSHRSSSGGGKTSPALAKEENVPSWASLLLLAGERGERNGWDLMQRKAAFNAASAFPAFFFFASACLVPPRLPRIWRTRRPAAQNRKSMSEIAETKL